jgi:hypothetical protein
MNETKPEATNTLGPHRRCGESWEHYINRRINDAPDADYQARHQKLEEWVKQHSLEAEVSQEEHIEQTCKEREHMERELPVGWLMVHGYLWRDPYGPRPGYTHRYYAYLDSKGQKFHVDEWEADDCTTEPLVVETPYMLHCPRIGRKAELNPDGRGYFLTDEVNRLGAWTCSDQIVCVAPAANLDSLVGKHVRFACTVEYIRETYLEDDSCFDRVYLVPMGEAVEVDLFGRAAEDRNSQATIVHLENGLNDLVSGESKHKGRPRRRPGSAG